MLRHELTVDGLAICPCNITGSGLFFSCPYQSDSVYDVETFTTANNTAHFLVSRKLNRSAIGVAGKMYPQAWQVRMCSFSLNS